MKRSCNRCGAQAPSVVLPPEERKPALMTGLAVGVLGAFLVGAEGARVLVTIEAERLVRRRLEDLGWEIQGPTQDGKSVPLGQVLYEELERVRTATPAERAHQTPKFGPAGGPGSSTLLICPACRVH